MESKNKSIIIDCINICLLIIILILLGLMFITSRSNEKRVGDCYDYKNNKIIGETCLLPSEREVTIGTISIIVTLLAPIFFLGVGIYMFNRLLGIK